MKISGVHLLIWEFEEFFVDLAPVLRELRNIRVPKISFDDPL